MNLSLEQRFRREVIKRNKLKQEKTLKHRDGLLNTLELMGLILLMCVSGAIALFCMTKLDYLAAFAAFCLFTLAIMIIPSSLCKLIK